MNFFRFRKLPTKNLDGSWNRGYSVYDPSGNFIGTVYHYRLTPNKSKPWVNSNKLPEILNMQYKTRQDAAEKLYFEYTQNKRRHTLAGVTVDN